MISSPMRRAGRPSSTVLSASKIVRSARRLLADQGNFTMSALAQKLGVAPSSLYNHFQSRDEVLGAISDAVINDITLEPLIRATKILNEQHLSPTEKLELWTESLSLWGKSYRDAFSESTDLVTALALTPIDRAPQTLHMYDVLVQTLRAFGCPEYKTLNVIESLEAFLLGSAVDAHAPESIFNPAASADEYPYLQDAYTAMQRSSQTPAESAFSLGLEAILHGLARTAIQEYNTNTE
ncbi:TetR/AcrR family transcriptional regulator [Rothia dentocariosa]|uniref:Tetracycline repressor protein n=3 Tax=Micrococcaceae TaxID=1268 RepID=A0AAE5KP42_9MICC|nr:tetracycline repressor protein [Rothia sp. HMSC064D08]PAK85704.1 tetracycline repressor protein [Rothia dentocariosa]TFI35408.1 TetR/AcrR family transcriptional regulator [Rothia dentocariosa]